VCFTHLLENRLLGCAFFEGVVMKRADYLENIKTRLPDALR
jgi:hypothetical protein